MASKKNTTQDSEPREIRLYLIAPDAAAAETGARLTAAIEAGDVAALLFPAECDGADALAAAAQAEGIAVIANDGVTIANADGFHVDGDLTRFAVLRQTNDDAIIGFGGVSKRDDGMTAAEAGADYIVAGRLTSGEAPLPLEDRGGLLSWWQAVMTVPCVARAETEAEAIHLAEAGADFVALAPALWTAADATPLLNRLTERFAEIGEETADTGALLEKVT